MIFQKLQLSFVSAEKCRKFVVKPERIYQHTVDPADFLFCSVQITSASCSNRNVRADGMDQVGFIFDIGINYGIAESNTVFPVGIASSCSWFAVTYCQFQGCLIGFRRFAGVVCFNKIKAGNQCPGFLFCLVFIRLKYFSPQGWAGPKMPPK